MVTRPSRSVTFFPAASGGTARAPIGAAAPTWMAPQCGSSPRSQTWKARDGVPG
eukprot:CAMPEP_0175669566 /NCGR_PEP_ID=MMETSP0097-20121207/19207_1 /TAXON_ID=311494 /ORGANISM="Alexandrium monilatum, Strain CCMP3105" /LENGTH=53 /DNA_ID=CAMNT_0016976107 /DNA_START=73 /DNA_END=230 /DNA_ORIENTATION=+